VPAAVEESLQHLQKKRKSVAQIFAEADRGGGPIQAQFSELTPIHPPPPPFVAGVVECVPTALKAVFQEGVIDPTTGATKLSFVHAPTADIVSEKLGDLKPVQ
jgi:hypothetical protein